MRSRTRQNLPKEIKHRGSREFVLIPITNRIKLLECIQWLLCRLSFKMAFTPFAKLKKNYKNLGEGLVGIYAISKALFNFLQVCETDKVYLF